MFEIIKLEIDAMECPVGLQDNGFAVSWSSRGGGFAGGLLEIHDRFGSCVHSQAVRGTGAFVKADLRECDKYVLVLKGASFTGEEDRKELVFTTGLFGKYPFSDSAKWLCASEDPTVDTLPNTAGWGTLGSYELVNEDKDEDRAYLYVKDFSSEQPVFAQVHICALGYYELYLNGNKIGDHVLDPGFTVYDKRGLMAVYELTGLIRDANRISVLVGNGFYNQSTPDTFGYHNASWRGKSRFIMELVLRYADGSERRIVSDSDFRFHESYITYQNIRSGEHFDMRLKEYCGGYMGSVEGWKQAIDVCSRCDFSLGLISLQQAPPIRETREIAPCAIGGDENRCVVKFPENMTGWISLNLKGERGREAVLVFVERDPLEWHAPDLRPEHINQFHVHKEFQTWRIILSGEEDVCRPCFTYYGFQYVIIEGLGYMPELGDIRGIFVHTDLKPTLEFECSEPLFNSLHSLVPRTFTNNFHSIPTDCPHREKNGYTGDGWITCEYAMYNFDMRGAYKKWFLDIADDQQPDGNLSGIVPNCDWETCNRRVFDILWSGGGVMLCRHYYEFYGDKALLGYMWEPLSRYMDYVAERTDTCMDNVAFLGDWLEPGADFGVQRTKPAFTNAALYYAYNTIMAGFAAELGLDTEKWLKRAERVKTAINEAFLLPDGSYSEVSQTAHAVALEFGIVPCDMVEKTRAALVRLVEKEKGHPNTGLLGTRYIFDALCHAGRWDMAGEMLRKTDFPSFGYMLKNNTTTIWESWEGHISLDHPMMGSYDAWLVKTVGGISYTHKGIKLCVPPAELGLTGAKTAFDSPLGRVALEWKRNNGKLTVAAEVPENISCVLEWNGNTSELAAGITKLETE